MSEPRGQDLAALARAALAKAGEAEAEVVLRRTRRGFARFAMGELGQHMELSEPLAQVRVARGLRVAQTTTNTLEEAALVRAIHEAARAAERVPETTGFTGFADDREPTGASPARFAESTHALDAEGRAERVGRILARIQEERLIAAGALETRTTSLAVATTRGRVVSHDGTSSQVKVWALETAGAGGAAGYGGATHRDVDALPIEEETERAIRICKSSKNPGSLDVGSYDVVLEPVAVAELIEWLAMIAFTATGMEQGTSPLRGRIGERITGESVTMTESPIDDDSAGLAAPFDREGVWRRKVPLIENGVARGVLYDRATASRAGVVSTGSALLLEGEGEGSVGATAIAMNGGAAESVDELVSGVRRGLYICRLHYVNGLLDPRRAVMTGLTRDGCFLIENGKIAHAVGNMRFTDSFLEGLARADGMTRARQAIPTWNNEAGAYLVPAVRMRGFRFNGKSQDRSSV